MEVAERNWSRSVVRLSKQLSLLTVTECDERLSVTAARALYGYDGDADRSPCVQKEQASSCANHYRCLRVLHVHSAEQTDLGQVADPAGDTVPLALDDHKFCVHFITGRSQPFGDVFDVAWTPASSIDSIHWIGPVRA